MTYPHDNPAAGAADAAAKRMRRLAADAAPAGGIPVLARRDGPLPLSFAQQRQWFFAQLYPASAAYHVPRVLRLRGALDPTAVSAALNDLVARHEPLRTVFGLVDGEPRQWIRPAAQIHCPVEDVDEAQPTAPDTALARRLQKFIARRFDLTADPMLRAVLLRLAPDDHVLALVMHHIATDGWSLGVLERELSVFYAARRAGVAPSLPPLAVQYADYAAWQRDRLQGTALDRHLSYWRGALAGAPGRTELPLDRAPPLQPGLRGAETPVRIDPDLTARLRAVARSEGSTPFMLLLAAFQVLLARHGDMDDVVVGVPVAGRNRVEAEALIGMFVNTMALRARFADDPPFRELLGRVRQGTLAALDHQDLPFEKLVDELRPSRELGDNPLFNVAFAFQNMPRPGLRIDGVEATYHPLDCAPVRFDLELALGERDGAIAGRFRYDRDLFDEDTVSGLARRFGTLLEGIAAEPDLRVSVLPLLGHEERALVCRRWAVRRSAFPRDQTIHATFRRQAEATPDAVAVEDGELIWSYAALNARSDAVAAVLARDGVRRGDRVAVCLPRGAELVAAMLGVLKAGACYVPLDSEQPAARAHLIANDAGARFVLALPGAPAPTPAGVRRVDIGGAVRGRLAPVDAAGPRDLAYVMYTSGSTGTPKGVAVDHRAVLRLVCDSDYVRVEPSDRIAQIANPAFDAATFEIWGALLNGARVVIVSRDDSLSHATIRSLIDRGSVTTMFLTTALFNALARAAPDTFGGLRHLLFGGEAADPGCVRDVIAHGPPLRLLHVYGPTEATTFSTWQRVEAVPADAATVPIGVPIANTEALVLDRHMQAAPVGVCGDLYIGGDGLAQGYLGRPAHTAQAFVPYPLSDEPGARVYRTGDRARWRRDGALEFVGRRDDQVKLRGFRVEPAEVTNTLLRHPAIAQAATVHSARGDSGGRLLAYAVARPGQRADEQRLLAHLRASLPGYMVPARVLILDRLPLTPNGKLDRAALPDPAAGARSAAEGPGDVVDAQVLGIWRDVLGAQASGPDEDFFAAGGHSLLSIALLAEVERVTGVRVGLAEFLRSPTAGKLAALVRSGDCGEGRGLLVPIRRRGARRPFFFVPGGGGGEAELAYVYGALATALDREQPVYGLRAPGSRDNEAMLASVERIAAAFAAQMRSVQPDGPYYLGGECIGGVVAFETARQLVAAGHEVGVLVLLESRPPCDLAERRIRGITARRTRAWVTRTAAILVRGAMRQLSKLAHSTPRTWPGQVADAIRRFDAALHAQRVEGGIKRQRGVHQRTVFSYRPGRYAGRITLIVPERNSEADPTLGWAQLAGGGVEVHRVPGDHYSYVRAHAAETAECLQRCLARSMDAGGGA